ncbi:hypothetical protein ACQEU3_39980 [Spirillospora sp. CA-253888]
MDVAAGLIARLRRLGYTISQEAPGIYEVTAHAGRALQRRPRLALPEDVLTEYVSALRHDADEAGLTPLDLIEVHIQEELDSVDHEGRNYTTAVGVRRGHLGRPEWFTTQDRRPPLPDAAPDPDLCWGVDRPDDGSP